MLTIITRTSNRPALFRRLRESIQNQTINQNEIYHLILADNLESYQYAFEILNQGVDYKKEDPLPAARVSLVQKPNSNGRGFYNLYLNEGVEIVANGWIMFVDDDDYLVNNYCLQEVVDILKDESRFYIIQFLRGTKVKPPESLFAKHQYRAGDTSPIVSGKIGSSCIIVPATMAKKARWDDGLGADYRYIRDLALQFPYSFYPIPVVQATKKGNKGKNIHQ